MWHWPRVSTCQSCRSLLFLDVTVFTAQGDTAPRLPTTQLPTTRGYFKYQSLGKSKRKATQPCDTITTTLVGVPETFPHLPPQPTFPVTRARLTEAQAPPPRLPRAFLSHLNVLTGKRSTHHREWREGIGVSHTCSRTSVCEVNLPSPSVTSRISTAVSFLSTLPPLSSPESLQGAGGEGGQL